MLFCNDMKKGYFQKHYKLIVFSEITSVLRYMDHRPPIIIVIPTEKIKFKLGMFPDIFNVKITAIV